MRRSTVRSETALGDIPASVPTVEERVSATGRTTDKGADATLRRAALGITVLSTLAVLYTLFAARIFLVPIAYAILLSLILSPLVRLLERWHLSRGLAAAIVVIMVVAALSVGIWTMASPVQRWVEAAPSTLSGIQGKIQKVLKPVQRVQKTAEQVQQQTNVDAGTRQPPAVIVQGPSLSARIFGTTQRLLTSTLVVIILLYFLLAAGDLFLQKLIKVLPNVSDKKKAVRIARETQRSISTYLLTVAGVYVAEGILVTGAMFLLGMPTPAVWGALIAVLEFIPYVGATVFLVALTAAAFANFDSVGHALLVPATFLAINIVQANVVNPIVLGYRLSLNPVAVFVGLTYWFWIWGVPGAFVAVPLIATFKILCDHIEALTPVGEFLGQRNPRGQREEAAAA